MGQLRSFRKDLGCEKETAPRKRRKRGGKKKSGGEKEGDLAKEKQLKWAQCTMARESATTYHGFEGRKQEPKGRRVSLSRKRGKKLRRMRKSESAKK